MYENINLSISSCFLLATTQKSMKSNYLPLPYFQNVSINPNIYKGGKSDHKHRNNLSEKIIFSIEINGVGLDLTQNPFKDLFEIKWAPIPYDVPPFFSPDENLCFHF